MNNEKLLSKDVNVIHSLNNSIKFYTHTHIHQIIITLHVFSNIK